MNWPICLVSFALLLFVGLTGCNTNTSTSNTHSPVPSTTDTALQTSKSEDDFQNESDDEYKIRAEVRHAVTEFVQARLPSWTLKGIASQVYVGNTFWSAADIEKDGHSVVINLVVRKFFPESGNPYWKAVLIQKTLQDQLHNLNDAEVLKKLNEANSSSAEEGDADPRQ